MKFSKMLALSRAGKSLGSDRVAIPKSGFKMPERDPNYRGGYYATAHMQHHYFDPRTGAMNMDPKGRLPPSSTHPQSPAKHGPKGDHARIAAPRSGGGMRGNPNHEANGRFGSG